MSGGPAGLLNLRDVAALTPIAPGVLLRSDAPQARSPRRPAADPATHDAVDSAPIGLAWPPASAIDLRATGEGGPEHPLAGLASIIRIELFDSLAPEHFSTPSTLLDLYEAMLEAPIARRLVDAVTATAIAPAPVLVHCTAGKDRTGVVVAMALALAGVAREHIVADYAATQAAMASLLARWSEERAMPLASADVPAELFEAPAPVMSAFLDRLEDRYGGASTWFVINGGDPQVPARLAQRFALVPAGAQ